MDRLAEKAEIGMASMVPEDMAPGSDTANLSVMGYDPKIYYTGRSPLEALSIGVDMADDDISSLIDADLKGAIYMIKYAQPHLVDNGGAIVNVSSVWGVVGASCESVYSAAKGGLIAFTKAMAKELAPSGVRVNCVAPGVIDTAMNARFDERELAAITEDIPLGRFGTADEVADAIFWLSDRATYVTGQCLGIDGGYGQ